MAYNGKNFLTRVVEIQNLTLEHTKRGASQRWVFENVIRGRYLIGLDTYYKYLSRNAKRELREMGG